MERLLFAIGILCLTYCFAIAVCGFGTYFFLVWGVMGTCLVGLGVLQHMGILAKFCSMWYGKAALGIIGAGILAVLFILGMIFSRYRSTAAPDAEYCLVLGAQWKKSGPSNVLKRRLDTAVRYLTENEETTVIVSGGKGSNEIMAEADGMYGYLVDAGIESDRILVERESSNTIENIRFSQKLMDKKDGRVVVVTNNFHMFRALGLARKQGLNAEGEAADALLWMQPNNLLREVLGVVKDFLAGNM